MLGTTISGNLHIELWGRYEKIQRIIAFCCTFVEPGSPFTFFCIGPWIFDEHVPCQWKMGQSSFSHTKSLHLLNHYIISIYIYYYIYISTWTTREHEHGKLQVTKQPPLILLILLMEEILHQFIGSLPYYLQGFSTIPGGCLGFLPCQEYHRIFFGGGRVACQKTLQSPSCGGPTLPGHVADLHSRLRSSSANTEERTRTKGWLGVCWVPFFHRKKS